MCWALPSKIIGITIRVHSPQTVARPLRVRTFLSKMFGIAIHCTKGSFFIPTRLSELLNVFVAIGPWPIHYVLGLCVLPSTTLSAAICLRSP